MTQLRRADPLSADCTSRRFIELVGDKWTLLILLALRRGPRRNGDLMRTINGISQKMLTQTLRRLVANGLVARKDMLTIPPHVEYALTDLGRSLESVMRSLDRWFEKRLALFKMTGPH
ncbi:MAG: helix-turn-helix transcriptional regulator [Caldilineaceae bacterium]|nr:helix-turn-helix transcriptional regulator [Caldilineaceae bacterium]